MHIGIELNQISSELHSVDITWDEKKICSTVMNSGDVLDMLKKIDSLASYPRIVDINKTREDFLSQQGAVIKFENGIWYGSLTINDHERIWGWNCSEEALLEHLLNGDKYYKYDLAKRWKKCISS